MKGISVQQVVDYYRSFIALQQHRRRVPGVQAAVFEDGGLVWSGAFGHANTEGGVLEVGHLFQVGSHAKTIAAIALMRLVEQRELGLDDAVATHLPALVGTPVGRVMVRQLLNHTAGLARDGEGLKYWDHGERFPDKEWLLAIAREPGTVVLEPGQRFKYSNLGYGILGLVVEAVSGRPYAEHVEQAIVAPLGLRHLVADLDRARTGRIAVGYGSRSSTGRRERFEHRETGALTAATGGYANAADLAELFSALLPADGRLLSEGSKALMRDPAVETGVPGVRYGLGLSLVRVGGRELIAQFGSFHGYASATLVDPDRRMVVSVMTNAIDGPAKVLARAMSRLVTLAASRPRGDGELRRFVGRFANQWGVVDVAVLGARLYRLRPTKPDPTFGAEPLEVVDGHTLLIGGESGFGRVGENIRYEFGEDGSPLAIITGGTRLVRQPGL